MWVFFAEALPARLARQLGSLVITETMERRPELGLRSYDRLFPNQDTMPDGGFGNLIALPLQKCPRAAGNSVFVDRRFLAYPDQWAYLSSLRRMARGEAQERVDRAAKQGRILGIRLAIPGDDAPHPDQSFSRIPLAGNRLTRTGEYCPCRRPYERPCSSRSAYAAETSF